MANLVQKASQIKHTHIQFEMKESGRIFSPVYTSIYLYYIYNIYLYLNLNSKNTSLTILITDTKTTHCTESSVAKNLKFYLSGEYSEEKIAVLFHSLQV